MKKNHLLYLCCIVIVLCCVTVSLFIIFRREPVKVAQPTNLRIELDDTTAENKTRWILRWDEVPEAFSYIVSVDDMEYGSRIWTFDLSDILQVGKKQIISVYAVARSGNDYVISSSAMIEYSPMLVTSGLEYDLGDDYKYYVKAGEQYEDSSMLVLPDTHENIEVVGVQASGFSGKNMESVRFPRELELLGEGAFYNCDNLTAVQFSQSMKTVGDRAFSGCKQLSDVHFEGKGVTVGMYAFSSTNLTQINDQAITAVGQMAFSGTPWLNAQTDFVMFEEYLYSYRGDKERLTASDFPKQAKIILGRAFMDANRLKEITLPEQIEQVQDFAFAYNEQLETVNLPQKEIELGKNIISGTGITSFTFPDSYRTLPEHCLSGSKLTELILSKSFRTLTRQILSDLQNVELHEGLINLGKFFTNLNVTTITLPNSVSSLSADSIYGCNELTTIYYGNRMQSFDSMCIRSCKKLQAVLPRSDYESTGVIVGAMQENAVYQCASLQTFVLPALTQRVYGAQFGYCPNLQVFDASKSVTTVSASTINSCSGKLVLGTRWTTVYMDCALSEDVSVLFRGTAEECKLKYFSGDFVTEEGKAQLMQSIYYYSATPPQAEGKFWQEVQGIPTIY